MGHVTVLTWQRDVNRVGMTAKVTPRFKQCDFGAPLQGVRCGQPRNARANDGNARLGRWRADCHQRAEDKNVAKRPEANKEGREEENRFEIAPTADGPRRLRNNENVLLSSIPLTKTSCFTSANTVAKFPRGPRPGR